MEERFKCILSKFAVCEGDIRTYSPLTLAYLGDAVYELMIRTMVTTQGNAQVNKLHKKSTELVKASSQAQLMFKVMDLLSEEEQTIYKRGRNAKSTTIAKNASMSDYRTATGFEALCGYLYLTGRMDRLAELLIQGLDRLNHESVCLSESNTEVKDLRIIKN